MAAESERRRRGTLAVTAVLTLLLGVGVGMRWWGPPSGQRAEPVDEVVDRVAADPGRMRIEWRPAARELVETGMWRETPAEQPVARRYRLLGTVRPEPGQDCTIEFVSTRSEDGSREICSVDPSGSFRATLTHAEFPRGKQVFARVRIAEDLVFAGPVPTVSGVTIEIVQPIEAFGRVIVDPPSSAPGIGEALEPQSLIVGLRGWLGDRSVRAEVAEDGRFAATLRPAPDGDVPVVVFRSVDGRVLSRSIRRAGALAQGVEIRLDIGAVTLEFVDGRGRAVEGPVHVDAGWCSTFAQGEFVPLEPESDPETGHRQSFVVAAGVLAGTATAPAFAPTTFRHEVRGGLHETQRVTLRRREPTMFRVALRNDLGRPTSGWVFVGAAGFGDVPGAFAASATTSGPDCIAEFELPSAQPLDVLCGGERTPDVGSVVSEWDPRRPLRMVVPRGVRFEIVPHYVAGNPVVRGSDPVWMAVPHDGGAIESGVAVQTRVIAELALGTYDILVADLAAGFAGVATASFRSAEPGQVVHLPMLPMRRVEVRLSGPSQRARAGVRLRGLRDETFEGWFARRMDSRESVTLRAPDLRDLAICVELADGRSFVQAWDGAATVDFRLPE